MPKPKKSVGAVRGRSDDLVPSMRDRIVDGEGEPLEEDGPALDLGMDSDPIQRTRNTEPQKTREGKKRRNHKKAGYEPDYFAELDEILAESYVKQEAAAKIVQAFTRMMEARGIQADFEDERFERAAGNMAVISMTRQMAWLFGLGPELSDRIAEHMVDRLFAPANATKPKAVR